MASTLLLSKFSLPVYVNPVPYPCFLLLPACSLLHHFLNLVSVSLVC